MKTFIEQKSDLRREIEERERENESLFHRIDHNESMIAELKKTLAKVGTEGE